MTISAQRGFNSHRPCLPEGITISHVIELIERHGPRWNLWPGRRNVLIRMIRRTSPADWLSADRDPVCYLAQQDLARELGITDRALRIHETELDRSGLLIRDTAANGRRTGHVLANGRRLGLNLRPIIERIHELLELDAEAEAEASRVKSLRFECSAARKAAKSALEALLTTSPSHQRVAALLGLFQSWPRRYATFRSSEALEAHLADVFAFTDEVRKLLSDTECSAASSGRAESQLPAITNKNLNILEGETNTVDAAKANTDASQKTAPGGAKGLEQDRNGWRGRNTAHDPLHWTPKQVRAICGETVRFYLDSICPDIEMLTDRDLTKAVSLALRDLAITDEAAEDALQILGPHAATLAIILIDANRDHPAHPIRNPGGTLRSFCKLHQSGKLNLAGALASLLKRSSERTVQSTVAL